jgi:hypothetical protein
MSDAASLAKHVATQIEFAIMKSLVSPTTLDESGFLRTAS